MFLNLILHLSCLSGVFFYRAIKNTCLGNSDIMWPILVLLVVNTRMMGFIAQVYE